MSQTFLPPKWLEQLCHPYAVLGISVAADDRQILKRYHTLGKLLHRDRYPKSLNPDQELASAIFSHLIKPVYEQLEKSTQALYCQISQMDASCTRTARCHQVRAK